MDRERDKYIEDHQNDSGLYQLTHQKDILLICGGIFLVSALIVIGRLLA